jgi:hypothetical protein
MQLLCWSQRSSEFLKMAYIFISFRPKNHDDLFILLKNFIIYVNFFCKFSLCPLCMPAKTIKIFILLIIFIILLCLFTVNFVSVLLLEDTICRMFLVKHKI